VRFEPTVPDFLVEDVRLDAAAARCVLPELFFAAVLPEERDDVLEPPRADDRAADFFEDEREADLPADFAVVFLAVVFLAVVFLAAVFLAPDFAALFLAVVFLAAVFLAAVFLAPLFFEAALFVLLAAVFLAAVFFAPLFFAPDLAADFVPPFFPLDERRALLFFAVVDADPPAPPALLILVSLGLDLSSVGMNASFKGLRVHRHACKRQRRYIKRVPINGKCPK
jgi:cell division protein FtsW (lipid II flippase)